MGPPGWAEDTPAALLRSAPRSELGATCQPRESPHPRPLGRSGWKIADLTQFPHFITERTNSRARKGSSSVSIAPTSHPLNHGPVAPEAQGCLHPPIPVLQPSLGRARTRTDRVAPCLLPPYCPAGSSAKLLRSRSFHWLLGPAKPSAAVVSSRFCKEGERRQMPITLLVEGENEEPFPNLRGCFHA